MDRRRPLVDAMVAVAAFALSAAVLAGAPADPALREADLLAYLLLAVYCGSVAFRRSHPVAVVAVSFAAALAYAAADYFAARTPVALLTVYTAAVRLDDRPSRRLLVAALVAGALFATVGLTPANPVVVLLVAGAWTLGRSARARRLYTEALEVKNRELEQAQHDLARQAVTEERLRIARELHDVVAHSMSVVAVHAGTGRMVAAADAEAAQRALETIETTTLRCARCASCSGCCAVVTARSTERSGRPPAWATSRRSSLRWRSRASTSRSGSTVTAPRCRRASTCPPTASSRRR